MKQTTKSFLVCGKENMTHNAVNEEITHPLLNKDSKHYSMFDGIEAIERMEQMFTTSELMAWAKLSTMKYRLRIGNKDCTEKEVKKIKTYEAYYKYLSEDNNE